MFIIFNVGTARGQVELELRPLLRQAAAAMHASLKDRAGALPPPEHGAGGVSPGVGALLEVLDTNLPVLRARLDDRNFALCLRVRCALPAAHVCVGREVVGWYYVWTLSWLQWG